MRGSNDRARATGSGSPPLRAAIVLSWLLGAGIDVGSANARDESVPEPAGYRLEAYDAPVPDGLAGARTVAAAEVRALVDEHGAVVVDVIPEHRRPPVLPEGQVWFPVPHAGLPGALWLPDTGFGTLAPVTERYLIDHLERATGGDRAHPLVFYCRMDCWMSWNAAKRALAAGYTRVAWYRDGIDDWRFEDLPTEPLTPAPGARQPGDPVATDPATETDQERP